MPRVSRERLSRAAALLAGGASPAAAARELGVPLTTLRRWTNDPRWSSLFEHARESVRAEAGTEALLVLRSLLRSEDDRLRAQAARTLAAVAARPLRATGLTNTAGPTDTTDTAEVVRLLATFRRDARRTWEDFGRQCADRINRLIEEDPAAACRLLRDWHRAIAGLVADPEPVTLTSAGDSDQA